MKGLELSRSFYEQYGKPMLENEFADLYPYIAVGFVGAGSERFGFDDELSRDHDFEAGFTIYLPDESVVDRKRAFALERAYAKLPKEFMGVRRPLLSPIGGNRNGPVRTADFYAEKVGAPDGVLTVGEWLTIPDHALAEATNGEVFYDGYGEFSRIRAYLSDMPDDVLRKRLAGNLVIMSQAGQYNFTRCLDHGETEGAALAAEEFVRAALHVFFLLRRKPMPFYKWSFRALRELGETEAADLLSEILLGGFRGDALVRAYDAIDEVATLAAEKLQDAGLSAAICTDLQKHANSVNDGIRDPEIRNMNLLVSV